MTAKIEMNEAQTREMVERLLEEFDTDFNSPLVEELREKFPRYVALYTPFIYKPDIVIRGINPSWFIGKEPISDEDKKKEDYRVTSLKGLHQVNAYQEYYEPKYHRYVEDEINSAMGEEFLKTKVMGWNNCFIQSGGQQGMTDLTNSAKDIDRKNNTSHCMDLINKSLWIAKKLEQIIQPRLTIYAGREAGWSSRWNNKIFPTLESMRKKPKPTSWGGQAIVVKHFSYPDVHRQAEIVSEIINCEISN